MGERWVCQPTLRIDNKGIQGANMKRVIKVLIAFVILTSCTKNNLSESTINPINPTTTPTLSVPISIYNDSNKKAVFFEQDFEQDDFSGISLDENTWKIVEDNTGNHEACNILWDDYSPLGFGKEYWQDYVVEIKVRLVANAKDGYVGMGTRVNDETFVGYSGAWNFDNNTYDFANQGPYEPFSSGPLPPNPNGIYFLRMELFDDNIAFYINNQLLGKVEDNRFQRGFVNFSASQRLQICIDDIRAWYLDKSGDFITAPSPLKISTEIVASGVTADWGGYMGRIVRNQYGVFTNYAIPAEQPDRYLWQIAKRQLDGSWQVVASENAGQSGTTILIGEPGGNLYLIAWPSDSHVSPGVLWTIDPSRDPVKMNSEIIPGVNVHEGGWHYGSAGINTDGDLCVITAEGGIPIFRLGCFLPGQNRWITGSVTTEYQFKYTYIFPLASGRVSWVASRDETWEALGYQRPADVDFPYLANAVGYWHTMNIETDLSQRIFYKEESPTEQFPHVILFPHDGYLDTYGNMHFLYWFQGESTNGEWRLWHASISPSGEILKDTQLPDDIGPYSNIFQDGDDKFWILGSGGYLFPAGDDGFDLGAPYPVDLGGYEVSYAGLYITCPRHGTKIDRTVDVVFPTDNGTTWMYFSVDLPKQ